MLIINTCFIAEAKLVKKTWSEQFALKSNIYEEVGNSVKWIRIWWKILDFRTVKYKAFSQRHQLQWRIQDFPKFLPKLHGNERIYTAKGASLAPPWILHWTSHCVWVSFRNGLVQFVSLKYNPLRLLFTHPVDPPRWPSGLSRWQDICDDLRCLKQYRQ